jgi:hypothetical protein
MPNPDNEQYKKLVEEQAKATGFFDFFSASSSTNFFNRTGVPIDYDTSSAETPKKEESNDKS